MKDQSTAVSLLERLRDGPQDNLEDRFAREVGAYAIRLRRRPRVIDVTRPIYLTLWF